MTRFPLRALLAALVLCAAEVQAASEPAPAPAAQTFTTPATGSTTTLTLYLVLMVALLGGGAYLVRNGFTLLQPKMKGARKLQISETRMLGNRQFLVVAEYEDRKMLLGVCPGRIDYLATLSASEAEFPAIESERSDE
jgi:flagellar protein FliO/FliZ